MEENEQEINDLRTENDGLRATIAELKIKYKKATKQQGSKRIRDEEEDDANGKFQMLMKSLAKEVGRKIAPVQEQVNMMTEKMEEMGQELERANKLLRKHRRELDSLL